jgi:hypothetical protein
MSAPQRLEELVRQLEEARLRLEASADDPDRALAVLTEVNELARELSQEVERARRAVHEEREDVDDL